MILSHKEKKMLKKFPTFPPMARIPCRCKAERVGNFFQTRLKVSHFSLILSHLDKKFPTSVCFVIALYLIGFRFDGQNATQRRALTL